MAAQLKRYFIGFSTQDSAITGLRTFYDIELINRDLMAAFQTRVGERVMRPDYGCRLFDYVMEPLTVLMREKVISEVQRICALDQRVVTDTIQVLEMNQGFRIAAELTYLPWRVVDTFSVIFDRNDKVYFGF